MYINPDATVTAFGHCHDYGFQDDAIQFKFTTDAESIDKIFQAGFVPPSQFNAKNTLRRPRYGLANV